MRAILALTAKDIRLLLRDRAGFFVTFVFPLVYAVFLGVILANRYEGRPSEGVAVAVVDEDGPVQWDASVAEPGAPGQGPSNPYAASFPQGIAWGVLGCTAAFGLSLVVERVRGTLVRLRMAPLGRGHVLVGKAGACFVTALLLGSLLFAVAAGGFGVRADSYALLAAAMVSMSFAFVGLMMLLSVFGRTEQAASGITWTVLLTLAMIGGAMVPHRFMPGWLQGLASLSPVRWAILAMEGAVWRGFGPLEMAGPCALLLATGVICFTFGAVAFRWAEGRG